MNSRLLGLAAVAAAGIYTIDAPVDDYGTKVPRNSFERKLHAKAHQQSEENKQAMILAAQEKRERKKLRNIKHAQSAGLDALDGGYGYE